MLAQLHSLSVSVRYRRLVWAPGRSALLLERPCANDLLLSQGLADELGICIVYMGLVGARDLGRLVRLRRSPISKESPKTSSSS